MCQPKHLHTSCFTRHPELTCIAQEMLSADIKAVTSQISHLEQLVDVCDGCAHYAPILEERRKKHRLLSAMLALEVNPAAGTLQVWPCKDRVAVQLRYMCKCTDAHLAAVKASQCDAALMPTGDAQSGHCHHGAADTAVRRVQGSLRQWVRSHSGEEAGEAAQADGFAGPRAQGSRQPAGDPAAAAATAAAATTWQWGSKARPQPGM